MKFKTCSLFGLFTILYLCVPLLPAEEQQVDTSTETESQTEAMAVLMEMAEFLSQTQRFKVSIESRYDAVQENGQQIEFGESRKVIVSRPDHMRVDIEQSDGIKNLVIYDGSTITVSTPDQGVYAQAEKAGGIDTAITYFVKDLQMHLPLAMLFLGRLVNELENRVLSIDYVESTNILGKPAYHLAGQTETVDFQFWIAADDQPLPLRIVLTYKHAEGQPQYRAQFMNWDLAPRIKDAAFKFTPPQGAQKISFISQLQNVDVPLDEVSEQTGEQP